MVLMLICVGEMTGDKERDKENICRYSYYVRLVVEGKLDNSTAVTVVAGRHAHSRNMSDTRRQRRRACIGGENESFES